MTGRPGDMAELEWLVALEEIRQLKAQRDRYVVRSRRWQDYIGIGAAGVKIPTEMPKGSEA